MLTWMVLLFAVVLFVILPAGVLKKHYKPRGVFSIKGILWLLMAIVTWPLVPVGIAYIKGDRMYLSLFWVSFLFFIVCCSYWLVLHVNDFIALQNIINSKLGM